jgi:diguanylate cyclase (GGDEF)-like protein
LSDLNKNPPVQPSRFKVLVVDDDITARMLAQHALPLEGFEVFVAQDGLAALSQFTELQPDIVLMDIEMPNLNGYETCKQLRSTPFGKQIPILISTGSDDTASITTAYDAGATDFVTKPFNWQVLGQRLKNLIRASNTQTELIELKKSERRLVNSQRITGLGNWEWDKKSNEVYWSDQLYVLLGHRRGKVEPHFRNFLESVPVHERFKLRLWFHRILKNVEQGASGQLTHHIIQNDRTLVVKHQIESSRNERGELELLSGAVLDVTELSVAQNKIWELANYDVLTGLANRSVFSQELDRAIHLAQANKTKGAVLFLDLDNFKRINDTFGHGLGDMLLKVVAKRLIKSVRVAERFEGDTSFKHLVARFGGDEFTILLPVVKDVEEAKRIAKRIIDNIGRRVSLAGHELVITPSIGIALFPDDGLEVGQLLKNVDAAMYFVKHHGGKNNFEVFAEEMNQATARRLMIENQMRQSIGNNFDGFNLVYQPQVSLKSGQIIGVEALLRWQSDDLGPVSPVEFIPVAEESNLINQIGEWVLNEACRQTKSWHDEDLPQIRVAVNLSVKQFAKQNLEAMVKQALEDSQLPVRFLELEITENMLMDDVEGSVEMLHRLKELGVCLAIDDFGTGYSSLSYLKRFPIDRLKVDRSFITHVTTDRGDASVTQAIVAVAHSLDLSVTAEGVETSDQLSFLNGLECEEVQGYYFSKPINPEDLRRMLKANQRFCEA